MEIWILLGPDGRPFKGFGHKRRSGRLKAFDSERAANISAGLGGKGVTVKRIVIEEGE